jgi:hypothetical protein
MLSKKVCKKCYEANVEMELTIKGLGGPYKCSRSRFNSGGAIWSERTEALWLNEGLIDCYAVEAQVDTYLKAWRDNPPKKCPYFLEHTMQSVTDENE